MFETRGGALLREAVVCQPLRTPIGRYGGALRDASAADLASTVLQALLRRCTLAPEQIDDVLFGQCYPNGEAPAIGRVAALDAGFPVSTPGLQIDRRCGSGLQAVCMAAMEVQTGVADVVIAGGAESMSQAEFYSSSPRWGTAGSLILHDRLARARETAGGTRHPVPGGMIETAENLRRQYKVSREEQDELAAESHRRAVRAQDFGLFDDEIVPVDIAGRTVAQDEHPRRDTSLESLARLTPIMRSVDPDATVTAGNAAGQNDGAAACIVTTRDHAETLGLVPLASLRAWAVAGVPPETMGIGPVPATERAMQQAGLKFRDIDVIELNEAFAAQVLAVFREWDLGTSERDHINVNGSGISLGHPVGATGIRILCSLLHEMHRREARYGLETMCIGGGQGMAAIFERVT